MFYFPFSVQRSFYNFLVISPSASFRSLLILNRWRIFQVSAIVSNYAVIREGTVYDLKSFKFTETYFITQHVVYLGKCSVRT